MTPIHYGKENYDNFANVVMIILKNMVTKMTKDKRQVPRFFLRTPFLKMRRMGVTIDPHLCLA